MRAVILQLRTSAERWQIRPSNLTHSQDSVTEAELVVPIILLVPGSEGPLWVFGCLPDTDEGVHGGRRPKSLEGGNRGGVRADAGVGLWGICRRHDLVGKIAALQRDLEEEAQCAGIGVDGRLPSFRSTPAAAGTDGHPRRWPCRETGQGNRQSF